MGLGDRAAQRVRQAFDACHARQVGEPPVELVHSVEGIEGGAQLGRRVGEHREHDIGIAGVLGEGVGERIERRVGGLVLAARVIGTEAVLLGFERGNDKHRKRQHRNGFRRTPRDLPALGRHRRWWRAAAAVEDIGRQIDAACGKNQRQHHEHRGKQQDDPERGEERSALKRGDRRKGGGQQRKARARDGGRARRRKAFHGVGGRFFLVGPARQLTHKAPREGKGMADGEGENKRGNEPHGARQMSAERAPQADLPNDRQKRRRRRKAGQGKGARIGQKAQHQHQRVRRKPGWPLPVVEQRVGLAEGRGQRHRAEIPAARLARDIGECGPQRIFVRHRAGHERQLQHAAPPVARDVKRKLRLLAQQGTAGLHVAQPAQGHRHRVTEVPTLQRIDARARARQEHHRQCALIAEGLGIKGRRLRNGRAGHRRRRGQGALGQ